MFGNSKISLSASILCALEELRLALEVLLGTGIRFVGQLTINPGKIRKFEGGESREVSFSAMFLRRDTPPGNAPQNLFVIKAELSKKSDEEWEAGRMFFGFLSDSGDHQGSTWYAAHHVPTGNEGIVEIWVAQEVTDGPLTWYVGTGPNNRRTETGRLP